MKELYLCKKINYWRGEYVSTHAIADSLARGQKYFDSGHDCQEFCDYCKSSWKGGVRFVNHDGASVRYIVEPLQYFDSAEALAAARKGTA